MQISVFPRAFVFNHSYWATIRHWHFQTLPTPAPRKGLHGRLKSLLGSALACNEWWVWLVMRWYAFQALFSCNTPHSKAFRGSLSSWMGGGHDLTRPIASTNFLAFSAGFLSSVSWRVKTLLHFEAVINAVLWRYHSSHCHCFQDSCSLNLLSFCITGRQQLDNFFCWGFGIIS